jgi:hypothetical protein
MSLSVAACGDLESEDIEESHEMLSTTNGLDVINGLTTMNGLAAMNGLPTMNGLATMNGLSSTTGLMTSSSGRTTVAYLVRCALAAGTSMVKKDDRGNSHTFAGGLGLAPEWKNGACDSGCQERVSACMLAHVNTAGIHIPLWIVAQDASVGWTLNPSYPNQEGSFFGNIFVTGAHCAPSNEVAAYYCNGRDYDEGVVPGRIGAHQTNAPYKNPFSWHGYCRDNCTAADSPYASSGFKSCNGGWSHVVTVWRRAN